MSKKTTQTYTVQVEDTIVRYVRINIRASSAAEAVMMARRMAYDRDLEMREQAADRDPWVYSVEGQSSLGELKNNGKGDCLCDRLEEIVAKEGLDPSVVDDLWDEYGNDMPTYFCH
ncbi:MAG: hypothetical protein WCL27_14630 [Betaproteobacteria bacterium]